ncbi:MAG: Gfo/Idh/MocA family oxidoreductase [Planctomycetota bacterium]|nr:MAG: Gfo/Idh/MocA family oxidoreductase [Planctomycetota bacterium]
MVLNEKQRQIGRDNFEDAARYSRRQILTGAVAIPSAAAMYWGYGELTGNPVRTGIIGTGTQGRLAHITQSNDKYIKFVAYSEIRPSNQKEARKLFNEKYGKDAKNIKLYKDYKDMLKDPDIELIIIALPLHLHEPATVEALQAGKHVLCEKLMAKTIAQCKNMVRVADKQKKLLAVGHQRHYSYLYANCCSIIEQPEILGDVRHIQAYWHRNQTKKKGVAGLPGAETGAYDGWKPAIPEDDKNIDFAKYQYDSLEQLIQWRLDNKTGGGLMVELGSHQLDAASIFLHHARPTVVKGTGVVSFFTDGREVDDHIFLIYEFGEDAHNAVVTYSSICTNAFNGYGEQVLGTRGSLIVDSEQQAYLFKEGRGSKDTRITWAEQRLSRPQAESGSTAAWGGAVGTADTLTSRGYREEQEHLAWLIRNPDAIQYPSEAKPNPDLRYAPRCHGRVALADAVVALCANIAMKTDKRIEFKPEWFDPYSEATPEAEYGV